METISIKDFQISDLRVGTILEVEDFPEARKPAYKLTIDFGDFGIKKSSAQITRIYSKADLLQTQVICVVNFSPRQIGPFKSEVLTTGFVLENGDVILARPDRKIPNGAKLA